MGIILTVGEALGDIFDQALQMLSTMGDMGNAIMNAANGGSTGS